MRAMFLTGLWSSANFCCHWTAIPHSFHSTSVFIRMYRAWEIICKLQCIKIVFPSSICNMNTEASLGYCLFRSHQSYSLCSVNFADVHLCLSEWLSNVIKIINQNIFLFACTWHGKFILCWKQLLSFLQNNFLEGDFWKAESAVLQLMLCTSQTLVEPDLVRCALFEK